MQWIVVHECSTKIPDLWYTVHALQKQIGCFNHRVVTMAEDKLKREGLCIVY